MPQTKTFPGFHLREQAQTLRHHLQQCQAARSPLFLVALLGERIQDLAAPRLITTMAALSLIVMAGCGGL